MRNDEQFMEFKKEYYTSDEGRKKLIQNFDVKVVYKGYADVGETVISDASGHRMITGEYAVLEIKKYNSLFDTPVFSAGLVSKLLGAGCFKDAVNLSVFTDEQTGTEYKNPHNPNGDAKMTRCKSNKQMIDLCKVTFFAANSRRKYPLLVPASPLADILQKYYSDGDLGAKLSDIRSLNTMIFTALHPKYRNLDEFLKDVKNDNKRKLKSFNLDELRLIYNKNWKSGDKLCFF